MIAAIIGLLSMACMVIFGIWLIIAFFTKQRKFDHPSVGLLISLLLFLTAIALSGPDKPVSEAEKHTILSTATTPPYDDLARYPEKYKGMAVTFKGKIVQITGSGSHIIARVNITQDKYGLWTDTIWVNVNDGSRLLEGDLITLWGAVKGEREYRAVLGQSIRIPEVDAVAIEIVKKVGEQ